MQPMHTCIHRDPSTTWCNSCTHAYTGTQVQLDATHAHMHTQGPKDNLMPPIHTSAQGPKDSLMPLIHTCIYRDPRTTWCHPYTRLHMDPRTTWCHSYTHLHTYSRTTWFHSYTNACTGTQGQPDATHTHVRTGTQGQLDSTHPLPVLEGSAEDGQLVSQRGVLHTLLQETIRVCVLLSIQLNVLSAVREMERKKEKIITATKYGNSSLSHDKKPSVPCLRSPEIILWGWQDITIHFQMKQIMPRKETECCDDMGLV